MEAPAGDPMRVTAPDWYEALNAGKETVVCDLPAEAAPPGAPRGGRRRARVVPSRGRRRLGVGPGDAQDTAV